MSSGHCSCFTVVKICSCLFLSLQFFFLFLFFHKQLGSLFFTCGFVCTQMTECNSGSLKCALNCKSVFPLNTQMCVCVGMSFCSCLQVKHKHCCPRFTHNPPPPESEPRELSDLREPPPLCPLSQKIPSVPPVSKRPHSSTVSKRCPSSLTPPPGDGTLDLLPHCFQRGWMESRLCCCNPSLNSRSIC